MMERFRNTKGARRLADLLAALLLLQMALPIQAHSHFVQHDGITVLMCTLQGEKSLEVTQDGHRLTQPLPSAAMQFSDLLKDFTPALAQPLRVDTLYAATSILQLPLIAERHWFELPAKSRDPPLF